MLTQRIVAEMVLLCRRLMLCTSKLKISMPRERVDCISFLIVQMALVNDPKDHKPNRAKQKCETKEPNPRFSQHMSIVQAISTKNTIRIRIDSVVSVIATRINYTNGYSLKCNHFSLLLHWFASELPYIFLYLLMEIV